MASITSSGHAFAKTATEKDRHTSMQHREKYGVVRI